MTMSDYMCEALNEKAAAGGGGGPGGYNQRGASRGGPRIGPRGGYGGVAVIITRPLLNLAPIWLDHYR